MVVACLLTKGVFAQAICRGFQYQVFCILCNSWNKVLLRINVNDTIHALGVRSGENTEYPFPLEFTLWGGWVER